MKGIRAAALLIIAAGSLGAAEVLPTVVGDGVAWSGEHEKLISRSAGDLTARSVQVFVKERRGEYLVRLSVNYRDDEQAFFARFLAAEEELAEQLAAVFRTAVREAPPPPFEDGFVFVEGGDFRMGSTDSEADGDETPVRSVTLDGFWMSPHEVTQDEYKAVMGENPSNFKGGTRPVEEVSWYDAVEYCNALSRREGLEEVYSGSGKSIRADYSRNGYRLPTEAEWEYAARGGRSSEGYKYSGSGNAGRVAWYRDNSGRWTHSVGGKASNELGLYDMSGNVWEWVWDWYDGDYYDSGAQTNPRGPGSGLHRVRRGGSWDNSARDVRSSSRGDVSPGFRGVSLGFRPCRTAD